MIVLQLVAEIEVTNEEGIIDYFHEEWESSGHMSTEEFIADLVARGELRPEDIGDISYSYVTPI